MSGGIDQSRICRTKRRAEAGNKDQSGKNSSFGFRMGQVKIKLLGAFILFLFVILNIVHHKPMLRKRREEISEHSDCDRSEENAAKRQAHDMQLSQTGQV